MSTPRRVIPPSPSQLSIELKKEKERKRLRLRITIEAMKAIIPKYEGPECVSMVAGHAVKMADAIIAELEKSETE